MAKSLVIVESATKAKTLPKYLKCNSQVLTSVGHFNELSKTSWALTLDTTSTALSKKLICEIRHWFSCWTDLKNASKDSNFRLSDTVLNPSLPSAAEPLAGQLGPLTGTAAG